MGNLTYLAMTLIAMGAVIAFQWVAGFRALRRHVATAAITTLVCTAYLGLADSVAEAQRIWTIHEDRMLGLRVGNVPVEDITFFLLTNLMVVQGVILLQDSAMRAAARRHLRRIPRIGTRPS